MNSSAVRTLRSFSAEETLEELDAKIIDLQRRRKIKEFSQDPEAYETKLRAQFVEEFQTQGIAIVAESASGRNGNSNKYFPRHNLKGEIIRALHQTGTAMTNDQIYMMVSSHSKNTINVYLMQMADDGHVLRASHGVYVLPDWISNALG